MTLAVLRAVGIASALAATFVGVRVVARHPDAAPAAALVEGVPAVPAPTTREAARLDSLAREAWNRTPFRQRRAPAAVRFDPAGTEAAAAPPPVRPSLILSGITWGRNPSIVLEGLPGIEGPKVLARGDTAAGLTVRRIAPEFAIVAGYDTTWKLIVRNPWP